MASNYPVGDVPKPRRGFVRIAMDAIDKGVDFNILIAPELAKMGAAQIGNMNRYLENKFENNINNKILFDNIKRISNEYSDQYQIIIDNINKNLVIYYRN